MQALEPPYKGRRSPTQGPSPEPRAPRSEQGTGPTTDFYVMLGNLTDRQCKNGCAPRMLLSLGKQDHLSPVGRKWLQCQLVPALLEPPAKPFLHHGNFCLPKWSSSVTPRGLRRLSWLRSPQMGPESLGTWGALGPGLRDSLGGRQVSCPSYVKWANSEWAGRPDSAFEEADESVGAGAL